MHNSQKPILASLFVLCLLSGLSACTPTQTFTVADGKGTATVSSDGSSGTVKVTGSDGQQSTTMNMGNNATYPSSLPFPQYPSTKVTLTMANDGSQSSSTVSLDSGDTVEKIIPFYRNWFSSNGWKVNAETSTQGMGSITAQNAEKTASIMAMPGSAGHTTIQIIMSSDKK